MSNESGIDLLEVERVKNADIVAKEDAVVRAGLALSASIRDAEAAGRGTLRRAVSGGRLVLIGVGLLAVAGVGLALARRQHGKGQLPRSESGHAGALSNLGRAVAVAFAAAAGKHLVERWLVAKSIEKPAAAAEELPAGVDG